MVKRVYQTDRQTDRQTNRQLDRQVDRQTDRETDRQVDSFREALHLEQIPQVGSQVVEGVRVRPPGQRDRD